MHLYSLIPLFALLAGSALAGVVVARGPKVRVSWFVAGMLGCGCGWAMLDLLAGISTSAEAATGWFRAVAVFALAIGPLSLLTLTGLRPQLQRRAVRLAKLAAGLAGVMMLTSLLTPWCISDVRPVVWGGWVYHFGPLGPLMLLQEGGVPLLAVWLLLKSSDEEGQQPASFTRPVIGLGVAVPVAVTLVTDAALPMLGFDFPRLGTTSMALVGGAFWLGSFRGTQGAITDSGFARAILDNLPDGVALLESDGRIRSANESLARLVGHEQQGLMGHRIDDFIRITSAELAEELEERDTTLETRTGDTIPVALSSALIRDRQGGVIGLVLAVRDLRAVVGLRHHLVAAGRLAAMGELAAGIAHEVNNPIAFIQANLNLLRRHFAEVEEHLSKRVRGGSAPPLCLEAGPERIDASLGSVARMAAIVREVRGFAYLGSDENQSCEVNELLESALWLATLPLGARVNVERNYAELPTLRGAAQDLKRLLLTLISRAVSSVGAAGHVWLSTELCDDRIVVVIEDDGEAIRSGSVEHFFQLTFDPAMQRAGALELGISRQIVQQLGGELSVEPGARGGTCVRVRLWPPEADCPPAPEPEASPL